MDAYSWENTFSTFTVRLHDGAKQQEAWAATIVLASACIHPCRTLDAPCWRASVLLFWMIWLLRRI